MSEQTGADLERLYKIPEIEPELLYLFGYYCSVKGQEPLTFVELESWQRLTGNELSPGEVDLMFTMDRAFYRVHHKSE